MGYISVADIIGLSSFV